MGFVKDFFGGSGGGIGDVISGGPLDVLDIFGNRAASESRKAGELQAQSGREALALLERSKAEAQGFLEPLSGVGQQAIDQTGFLTDSQAQFDFLQNNPLFQQSLEQGQQATGQAQEALFKSAAARGRLSAGDTLQQVQTLGDISQRNALLAGTGLIQDQKRSIGDLLNFGQGVATNRANTALGVGTQLADQTTDIGAARAAGLVGSANAQSSGTGNVLGLAATAASLFSDPALKDDVTFSHIENGHNVYNWTWNEAANDLGLIGDSFGVLATEAKEINPDAVTSDRGFMKVNYELIGVKHGD
jgi:hypothetical protein